MHPTPKPPQSAAPERLHRPPGLSADHGCGVVPLDLMQHQLMAKQTQINPATGLPASYTPEHILVERRRLMEI